MATKKSTATKQARKPAPKAVLDLPGRLEQAMDFRKYPKDRGRYAKLAKTADVSAGQISAIVNKKRLDGITAATVVTLADALKVNPGWLLTGRGSIDSADAPTIEEFRSLLKSELDAHALKLLSDK